MSTGSISTIGAILQIASSRRLSVHGRQNVRPTIEFCETVVLTG